MENRVRNETAFNKLLEYMEENSSNYFLSTTSNLRDLYKITNPLYLFSDTFHDLILKFLTGIQIKKNFDVRKCARELARELNFYKIANPLKHLKTFDSIPSTVPLPTTPPATESKCKSLPLSPTEKVKEVSTDLKILSIEVDSNNCDTTKPLETSLEDALKGVSKDITTVINIVKSKSESNNSVVDTSPSTSQDADVTSTSKRKIEEVVLIREDEISRKKTSNGSRVSHLRKSPIQVREEDLLKNFRTIAKKLTEPICIIDDDDEDLAESERKNECYSKNSVLNNNLCTGKVKSLNNDSMPNSLLNESKKEELLSIKESNNVKSVDSYPADDDVLIIEDLCKLKPPKSTSSSKPKKPTASKVELPSDKNIKNSKSKSSYVDDAGDDLIIVENCDVKPGNGSIGQVCKVRSKSRQSCDFSSKKQSWGVDSHAKQTARSCRIKESSLGNDEDCIVYIG